ncbi:hypothetical protein EUX98_g8344 [Antrodiella citrinella]|uniref:HMG box domain-containing protein n=1 Tax=Antrodiella citrinella TaxID=2447956 RepID=A0A4S4M8B4_9APHY|nr:hypothetical protein EUX98_g8344 [Antrodiella citrinella]
MDPTGFEVVPENPNDQVVVCSPPTSPTLGPVRGTHSKKRDASYIPRPPNAFILFRSSFIRAQHIPGKIEGNHSALSKIIGKCWKALPREEKETWEAKAIVAQAEHRQKYPDWRFRPGANALAKVKDGPRKRTNRKGRGEAEKEERSRDNRCAKIADLLVAGKKGADLQVAIEEYDCKNGGGPNIKKEGSGVMFVQFAEGYQPPEQVVDATQSLASPTALPVPQPPMVDNVSRKQSRSLSPDAAHDIRFKTPLTSMFKRSSSAPARCIHPNAADITKTTPAHQDSVSPRILADCLTAFHADVHEGKSRVSGDITGASPASTRLWDVKQASVHSLPVPTSPVANFSPSGGAVPQSLWTQTYGGSYCDSDTYSPSVQSFDSDLEDNTSPTQSPLTCSFDLTGDGDTGSHLVFNPASHTGPEVLFANPQSSYSSLEGWADDSALKQPSYEYGSAPTFLSGAQSPMVYDPDRVMKDAFAAASTAPYEDWGVEFTTSGSYRFSSVRDIQSLQYYAQGWQDIARRQDDHRQLC